MADSNRKYFISKLVISSSAAGFAAGTNTVGAGTEAVGTGAVGAVGGTVLLHAAVNRTVLMATINPLPLFSTACARNRRWRRFDCAATWTYCVGPLLLQ